jgi:hypothetical protein
LYLGTDALFKKLLQAFVNRPVFRGGQLV